MPWPTTTNYNNGKTLKAEICVTVPVVVLLQKSWYNQQEAACMRKNTYNIEDNREL